MAVDGGRTTLGGAKRLTLKDAVAQSVGLMGPVFSIAFLVPLLVGLNASGRGAGNAAALSVVIAAIGVLGLGWIVAEYTRKIQAAGSLYDYVTDGLGARVGAAAGWLYYTGLIALGSAILPMIGGTIHDTVLAEFNVQPFPQLVWDLLLLALVAVTMYLGVSLSTRVQLILALISLTVVGIFSIFVIGKSGGIHHVVAGFSPNSSPTHWSGVLFGVLYGVLLFTGFETSANLGEETIEPSRDIPRAVLFSVLAIGGFYIIATFSQIAGFHFNLTTLSKNAGAPLFTLAGPSSGGGYASAAMRRIVELVVIFDMIAVLIGCAVSASRGVFAMARDRRLPRTFAKISSKGTPVGASNVVMLVYAVIITLTVTTSIFAIPNLPHYVAIFSWFSTYGAFAIVIIYLLISVGALRGLKDRGKPVALYLASLVGILVTAGAIFGSIYKVTRPTIEAPYAALVILVIGLVAAFVMRDTSKLESDFSGLTPSEQGPLKL
jgi:amino acid transporter